MAGRLSIEDRDVVVRLFRERVFEKMEWVPFPHQREWMAASEGYILLPNPVSTGGQTVRMMDGTIQEWQIISRPNGHARFLVDLGAFKVGKSMGAGMWATGFAAVPGARVSLVGQEYDITSPEFDYIAEALLSERGMNLKYDSYQNRPRDGKMWLDLSNGARYEAKSWERKDSLKGKEIDAYLFCEAYQLPGLEVLTDNSQNLRARGGYAVFATTPDRPWVQALHELGHGADPEWHCTCSVDASVNPYTFDAKAKKRDETLMTREKFAIHYGGKLGDFVGRVFQFQRGDKQFSPASHPDLFPGWPDKADRLPRLADITVPAGWEIVAGADTGTFYTGLIAAFSPNGDAFILAEHPNYRYTAGQAERDEHTTIPLWSAEITEMIDALGGRPAFWADANSQFKQELTHYGVSLMPDSSTRETRTEVAREYFQHGRVWLAPWLDVLPFELENAAWPEESTAAGKFERVKDRDHTLDALEHILVRRPIGRKIGPPRKRTWAESMGYKRIQGGQGNTHLGRL